MSQSTDAVRDLIGEVGSWQPTVRRSINMIDESNGPRVGEKAPEFLVKTPDGRFSLHQLAARYEKLILTTQDSYRFHPN